MPFYTSICLCCLACFDSLLRDISISRFVGSLCPFFFFKLLLFCRKSANLWWKSQQWTWSALWDHLALRQKWTIAFSCKTGDYTGTKILPRLKVNIFISKTQFWALIKVVVKAVSWHLSRRPCSLHKHPPFTSFSFSLFMRLLHN